MRRGSIKNRLIDIWLGTPLLHLLALLHRRRSARGPNVANVQPADGSGGYLHLGFEFNGQPQNIMQRIRVDHVLATCEAVMASQYTCAEAR